MIIDLDQLAPGRRFDGDVCVIGTGAAGLTVGSELLKAGLRVVMLDGGSEEHHEATQALYECDVTGLPFGGHMTGRFRVFGGSTTKWGGQSLPLSPGAFERKEGFDYPGWPIAYADLLRYYGRAASFLMTDGENFDTDLFEQLGASPPRFDSSLLRFCFSKWSPRPNLREGHRRHLETSTSVNVLLHANLTRIGLSEDHRRVVDLTARSLSGREVRVETRHVVLCVGGIETARVLLANNTQQSAGIGNGHDLVGRYFQDHPSTCLGRVEGEDGRVQQQFQTFYRRGLKYAPRVVLSPEAQRKHRTLDASAVVEFDGGAGTAYSTLRSSVSSLIRRRDIAKSARGVARGLRHLPSVAKPIFKYVVRGRGYTPNAVARVHLFTEQEPNRESRIRLSERRDALGVRKADICWRLTDATGWTVRTSAKIIKSELMRLGLGTLHLEDWLHQDDPDWQSHMVDLNHHMGTARMGATPESGVVDTDCRVHGIENLWIGGSAVFPTGGHSNPTLTLIALAMRLADTLRSTVRK